MKFFKSILLLLISVQMSACQIVTYKDNHIKKPFKKIQKQLQKDFNKSPTLVNESLLEESKQMLRNIEKAKDVVKHPPKLDGQLSEDVKSSMDFVNANSDKISKYFKDIEGELEKLVAQIHTLGAATYEVNEETMKPVLTATERAKHETLVLFSLEFMRNIAVESMKVIFPFTLGTYAEAYEDNETMMGFRKLIFEKYMAITGFIVLAEKDIDSTMTKIATYKKKGNLPATFSKSIGSSLAKITKRESKSKKAVDHAVEELDSEQFTKFKEAKAEFMKNFADKSFLYDPRNPDNIPVILLTWIGNLTWGGINTLVGLGWVIGAALVSPFTRHVDFPTIKISRSGSQIYADVSGTSYFRGKVSLGLFEMDQNAGWSFASAHEAGHSTQSALLGPLYLPMVLLSYTMNMGHGGFIETWADRWAHFHDDHW